MVYTPQSRAIGYKLHRAKTRLDELDTWIGAYVDSEPYVLTDEFNPDSGLYELTVSVQFPPPLYIGTIIGESVQSLRAVLDYVAWGLSTVDDKDLYWPIANSTSDFKSWKGQPGARTIHRDAIKILRDFQPDQDSDPNSLPQVFAVLHALSIEDKHRTLVLTGHWSGRGDDNTLDPNVSWRPGAFESDKQVVATWERPEDKPHGGVPTSIAFPNRGPGRGHHVSAFLRLAHGYIAEEVVPALVTRPYFVR